MDLMPELDSPVLFSVWKLQTACDPFVDCVWHGLDTPVTREEVQGALRARDLSHPISEVYQGPLSNWTRRDHIRRIAWFVENLSDDHPIELDVGVPSMNCHVDWIVQDGNHRLAAAIFRGDRTIPGTFSGSLEEVKKFTAAPPRRAHAC